MKRKALLAITGCTIKAFETYAYRDFLPIAATDSGWKDYSIEDAFALKVLTDAAQGIDLASASILANGALHALHPLNPFAYMGDENIWVAIVSYHWPEAPQDWVQKTVVAGRWSDIETKAKIFVAGLASDAAITGVFAVSAKNIANHVLTEARDFGLAEGEVQSVPDDLTGYPDWFQDIEGKRRALFSIEAEK